MENWKFDSPGRVVFGNGVSRDTGKHLLKLQSKSCLVVTDPGIVKAGLLEGILKSLEESGVKSAVYDQVQPEPPQENIDDAMDIYKKNNCDAVLGLGGGSALDVAKAVAMVAKNGGKFSDYAGIGKVPQKSVPLALIPTTSGTGSEVSIFSIMVVNGSKAGVVDHLIAADYAIVDPMLTVGLPRHITAATGLDTLCHHLESYISTNANPFSDTVCLEGLGVIARFLRRAVGNGNDLEARAQMSYASMLGGYAMNMTEGAAACHALAFALGAKFHVAHGLSNAVLVTNVLKAVASAEYAKLARLAKAMGENIDGLSDREAAVLAIDAIESLVEDVGCAISLRQFGVTENDLDALADETMTQVRVMGHSTYQLTREEVRAIFAATL
ncbi:iron-containing alcohol dehydrogenase [Deltaproteobacteria bacterium OttesenSCG-928-K17]|nr:iron-containing alcohol dehydrogenase [Deltaproteobacteria bacterium OttesenSCG-928-K17]